ncbi:MAG: glycosyl transferase group 1, partial [Thermoleophilia bacterium]|nr:glycosyl transferase group 1 [Thermoleophilia bacterium]
TVAGRGAGPGRGGGRRGGARPLASMSARPLRVAIVDPASWSLAYDEPLANALARAGCEVTLHCTRSPHVGVKVVLREDGAQVEESFYRTGYGYGRLLPRRLTRITQHPLDLAKLTRRLRAEADVVMVQWLPGRGLDVRAWARLAQSMPVTFTSHNAQEREGKVPLAALGGFSAVVAHSDGGARALREAGLPTVWRMAIGAYDQYATAPEPPEPPVLLPEHAPLVVLPGLLRPYKGVDVLLEAWPLVRAQVPQARLVIAGRPMGVDLPEAVPAGAAFIPRFVSDEELGWLLRRATVCCLPYRRIDMSGIAVSALACGTPLVVSDVGGLGEYVGRGALAVPPGDPAALAQALVAVLADATLEARLGAEARAAIATHYSWDAIATEYVRRLAGLLAAPSRV